MVMMKGNEHPEERVPLSRPNMANSDWIFNDLSEKISGIQAQKTELEKRLVELNRRFEALELIRRLYRYNGAEWIASGEYKLIE